MTVTRPLILGALLLIVAACATYRDTSRAMQPFAALDVARYAGTWYEIASFPTSFQRGCTATTATYAVIDAQTISVVNRCNRDTPDGPVSQIEGTARVVGPGQLRVRLGRIPFDAPYWVLWVAPDYSAAVVGVPQGTSGWILSRTPTLAPARLEEARAVLARNGYDLSQLQATVQR